MIAGFFAGILSIFYIYLSFRVILIRNKKKISLGNGGFAPLDIAIRAHGNFSEYVPIGMILLALLELNGMSGWIIIILGTILTLGRFIHFSAFYNPGKISLPRRVAGMILTFAALFFSGLGLIVQFMIITL